MRACRVLNISCSMQAATACEKFANRCDVLSSVEIQSCKSWGKLMEHGLDFGFPRGPILRPGTLMT